jgi:alpha-mannosidase II
LISLVALSTCIVQGDLNDIDEILIYGIPHSHTDAGWYWTYEYYYNLAKGILNSVFDHLKSNPEHRFTWSDHSFFRKWYEMYIKGREGE